MIDFLQILRHRGIQSNAVHSCVLNTSLAIETALDKDLSTLTMTCILSAGVPWILGYNSSKFMVGAGKDLALTTLLRLLESYMCAMPANTTRLQLRLLSSD
ncbi:hypothetical protein KCU85_g370, partial [Aureobasidium melanogenum]